MRKLPDVDATLDEDVTVEEELVADLARDDVVFAVDEVLDVEAGFETDTGFATVPAVDAAKMLRNIATAQERMSSPRTT